MTVSESKARSQPQMHTDAPSSLMWTAPEGASAIYSAGARSVAAPTSEVSPVRSPLAARPPGTLRHNRATPARPAQNPDRAASFSRLGLRHASLREFRIGVGHVGQGGVVELRRQAEQRPANDDAGVIQPNMRKRPPSDAHQMRHVAY